MDSINPTTPQFPTEHPKRPPVFRTLFPGPQACRRPDLDGSDCMQCDGCVTFADLTAIEAESLWVAAEAVALAVRDAVEDGELIDTLPAVCGDADELWQRRFLAAAEAIQVYLAAGIAPLPRCTAEEYVLCEVLTLIEHIIEDEDAPYSARFAGVDTDRLGEVLLPTTHVPDLEALDEVDEEDFEDALGEALERAASCCNTRSLLPRQWFLPHGELEPWVPESFFG